MSRAIKAIIDCKALQHNLAQVKKIAPHASIIAMIKANGYGHGLVPVAKALDKTHAFGVASIEEALSLRQAMVLKPIVLMQGFFEPKLELPEIDKFGFACVLHHQFQLKALQQFHKTLSRPLKVWIKIDTGMHRLGFPLEQTQSVFESLKALHPFVQVIGFMSHLARADEPQQPETLHQIARFNEATQGLPGKRSLANSAGILKWPDTHHDWVRPGMMLYGASPFQNRIGTDEGLKPVMNLRTEIISINKIKKDESIGYGGIFKCPNDMIVGVVAAGYGDGYPRLMPTGAPVLVNGKRVPLVGRVSMDMITVDLSSQPEAKIGDKVELWGASLPCEELASLLGTSAYELLTSPASRVKFEYLN